MNQQTNQSHAGAGAVQRNRNVGLLPGIEVKISSTFTTARNGETLMGYALEDGTIACVVGNKMETFESIPALWTAWDKLG